MQNVLIEVRGIMGTLFVYEDRLLIKRTRLSGQKDKEIILKDVLTVQYKNASIISNGYLHFTYNGSKLFKGTAFEASSDENTIIFNYPQRKAFEQAKAKIDDLINRQRGLHGVPQTKPTLDERPSMEENNKKIPQAVSGNKQKKANGCLTFIIIIAAIVLLFNVLGSLGKKDNDISNSVEVTSSFDFSSAELTKKNILKAVSPVLGSTYSPVSADVTKENGRLIVDVFFTIKTSWNEDDLVDTYARKAVGVFREMFTNPNVDKVWVWCKTNMIDPKGNESLDNVINCSLTKENASDINWDNFSGMVSANYSRLFKIADGSFIHPGIKRKLKKSF